MTGLGIPGVAPDLERREQVAELTRKGHSAREIAALLKTTTRTVTRDRRAAGLTRPAHRKWSPAEHRRALELLADGCSLREVASTLQRNPKTIKTRFKGMGWTHQQRGEYIAMRKLEKRMWGE